MKRMLGRLLPLVLALCCFPSLLFAQATSTGSGQAYPAKPVRIVVVFPPGGSSDATARIVFQKMTEQLGRQFLIDNRGGAAGTIGADIVAKSPPDGYTLMVQTANHVSTPHVYKSLPFDPLNDFIGVTTLARVVGMLVVHPSLPVKNTREYIALAKARPGEIVYGSSGNGSYTHLTMALLTSMTNTRLVHVPYKGGGPINIAIASGEVQAIVATIASVIPNLNAKRVRALAVTSDQRTTQYPDVPAIAETIPGYEFTGWVGAFAPKGTPKPVIDKLNAEIRKALADPGVASKLAAQTLDPLPLTPEEFAQRLKSDYDKYEKVVRFAGVRVD